ncbi:MAG: hypothetical protein MI757_06450 [Pirellulales bacterium]|nr:hypothetical protein [Pirellulales bacterium]
MMRPALWFIAFLAIACLAVVERTRPRVERAVDGVARETHAADEKALSAPRDTTLPRTKQVSPFANRDAVVVYPERESAADDRTPATTKPVPPAPEISPPIAREVFALPSADLAINEPEERLPKLPPAETPEEIAALIRIALASDDVSQTPTRLATPSITDVNPLRRPVEPPLSPRLEKLKTRLADTLEFYRTWPVNTINRSPWEVMHAAIAYGCQSTLNRPDTNQRITALGHLCFNGVCEGDSLLRVIDGRVVPRRGPGLQGHDGQLLAILAQSKVKIDYPVMAYGKKFTVADLVENEKLSVRSGTELTFQLIGLVHYLRGEEEEWTNDEGEKWTIRRMLQEEIDAPIRGAACGGTHRLMAISYALRKREKRGFKITGQYKRARQYTEDYHRYTFRLQNESGSFSTAWFRTARDYGSDDVYLRTSGHIFEWLAFSLPQEQMKSDKMVLAAEYLTDLLDSNRDREWKIGPLGHALHGLRLYQERVFTNKPVTRMPRVAKSVERPDRTASRPKSILPVEPPKADVQKSTKAPRPVPLRPSQRDGSSNTRTL